MIFVIFFKIIYHVKIFSQQSTWGLTSCVAKPTQACLSPCASMRDLNFIFNPVSYGKNPAFLLYSLLSEEREEIMAVKILEDSITFEAFIDHEDAGFEDDVCLRFTETCPEDEKVFYGGENNLYVTRDQARKIAMEILKALEE